MVTKQAKRSGVTRNFNKEIILSPEEKLLIWRRREDWNQNQAAQHYGLSVFNYKLLEYGKLKKKNVEYKKVILGNLSPKERCLIYRRRAKKTQKQIAKALGCSREWIRQQESGEVSCDNLLRWWEGG